MGRRVLQTVMGLFFVGTGLFKLMGIGVGGFAHFLSAAGIPFPVFNAILVIALEAVGGLVLATGAWITVLRLPGRIVAGLLAADMLVAIATVGLRAASGHPLRVDGTAVAGEPWRLPLELCCCGATLYLALSNVRRPMPDGEE